MTICHYNGTRSTVTWYCWSYDQRHVTPFRPISEAAHSWSYDNQIWWPEVENVAFGLRPRATFSTWGPSYLDIELTTVHHLHNVTSCTDSQTVHCGLKMWNAEHFGIAIWSCHSLAHSISLFIANLQCFDAYNPNIKRRVAHPRLSIKQMTLRNVYGCRWFLVFLSADCSRYADN